MKPGRIEAVWNGQEQCRGCSIRELALFADLQESDFNLIHLPVEEIDLDSAAAVYRAGDPGAAVYTLRAGLVKLVQYLPDGGQRIVRLLRPGDTLGLEVLVGEPYEHTALVLRRASLCRIPREVVNRLSVETPRLHQQLMKRWHQSVRQADEWLTELSTGNARVRVARLLLSLAVHSGTSAAGGMAAHSGAAHRGVAGCSAPAALSLPPLPSPGAATNDDNACCELFSREDVGAMLGITTETASRTIAEFRRQGVLTDLQANRFRCDLSALRRIAGDCA